MSIRVHTVHLDHATAVARAEQGREAASAAMVQTDGERVALDVGAGAVALPVLVGGDFNARSGEPAPQALLDFGFVETSGSAKTLRIDHLFAHRSAPFVPTSTKELFEGAAAVSDHPGVLVRFAPQVPKGVRLTRVVATGAFAFPLSLRGDRGPLSWERGWPAFPRATSGEPSIVTSELPPGAFAYKFLRRDVDWATGNNAGGIGEADNASAPVFP
jgi:hypothetical protein